MSATFSPPTKASESPPPSSETLASNPSAPDPVSASVRLHRPALGEEPDIAKPQLLRQHRRIGAFERDRGRHRARRRLRACRRSASPRTSVASPAASPFALIVCPPSPPGASRNSVRVAGTNRRIASRSRSGAASPSSTRFSAGASADASRTVPSPNISGFASVPNTVIFPSSSRAAKRPADLVELEHAALPAGRHPAGSRRRAP